MNKDHTINMGSHFVVSIPAKVQNENLHLTCDIEHKKEENTCVFMVAGTKEPEKPLFGLQKYLDAREGVCFDVKIQDANMMKMTAIYQHKDWWIRPAFPEKLEEIPERTQLLLMKDNKNYLVLLAVCGKEYRTDLRGKKNCISISVASNCAGKNSINDISLVFAWGSNPYQCCEDAVSCALKELGTPEMMRKKRSFPKTFEKLGWCSWDTFYHQVSEQGIFEKMEEFRQKNVPVKWALIDDGWMDADYDKQVLKGLNAAKDKFPNGLENCVAHLKNKFGIEQVGVWHAIMGYWNGIEQGSVAEKEFAEGSRVLPDGRIIPDAKSGKAFQFYKTWHNYLKNVCDIDFVKVDGQSAISLFYRGSIEYGKASREVQSGLNASAALYFNNTIINCMGMASEDMWSRPSSAISRSSDDFVPDVPHGFREHAIQNGYNSLLQGQFFWGDWDMFWSDHEEKWQNAVLRAVSGGPVYVSDKVGKTNPDCILPLIRKVGTVIRCEDVGVPTTDCLFEDPIKEGGVFKLFNRFHEGFVIAAFNIGESEQTEKGTIRVTDIPDLCGHEWYVYAHKSCTAAKLSESNMINFELDGNDAEIFTLLPARNVCALGILEKFIPYGCVSTVFEDKNRTCFKISEAGTFGVIMDKIPKAIYVNGNLADWKLEEQSNLKLIMLSCIKEDTFLEIIC